MIGMNWILFSPFTQSKNPGWLFDYINKQQHQVEAVPADYVHDRSRAYTSRNEWLDYGRQAWAGYFASVLFAKKPIGIITVFPQLTAVTALIKKLLFGGAKVKMLAWCFNMGRPYHGYKGHLARAVLANVDLFVVHSRAEIDIYSEWLQLPSQRFLFVPLSAELPAQAFAENEHDELAPYVVALGTANRDYKTLLRALAILNHRTIIVCGAHAIEGLDIPANVEIRSGLDLDACHELARKSRVNVIPIRDEKAASGQVTLIESMMLGSAMVVTRCAGTVDYVTEGEDALMVPPHDVDAMVAAIQSLWENASLRDLLANNAKIKSHAQYTFEAVGSRLQDTLVAMTRN